jgi:transposase
MIRHCCMGKARWTTKFRFRSTCRTCECWKRQTLKSEWLIRVESVAGGTTCRKCGERITEFHGLDAPLRLRHLPLFEVPVYLELRPKRYRCRTCEGGPTTTEQPSWYQRRSPNTTAYEQWLLRILINSTVSDVSHKLQVSEATVTGVLERWIETSVNWDAFSLHSAGSTNGR